MILECELLSSVVVVVLSYFNYYNLLISGFFGWYLLCCVWWFLSVLLYFGIWLLKGNLLSSDFFLVMLSLFYKVVFGYFLYCIWWLNERNGVWFFLSFNIILFNMVLSFEFVVVILVFYYLNESYCEMMFVGVVFYIL